MEHVSNEVILTQQRFLQLHLATDGKVCHVVWSDRWQKWFLSSPSGGSVDHEDLDTALALLTQLVIDEKRRQALAI